MLQSVSELRALLGDLGAVEFQNLGFSASFIAFDSAEMMQTLEAGYCSALCQEQCAKSPNRIFCALDWRSRCC